MLSYLMKCNLQIKIKSIFDKDFQQFGKVIDGYDFSECIDIMQAKNIPEEGNIYIANDDDLRNTVAKKKLSENFYGNMPIQIGYCNGNNTKLNALEYHKCSEIDVAVTDLVLILGDIREIKQNHFSSTSSQIFYVPQKSAIELYSTTLHFSPCKTNSTGFKSIIILAEGTNQPLSSLPSPKCDEDRLLWMQNKWLIAHKDSIPASKGAYIGITGDNLEIKYC